MWGSTPTSQPLGDTRRLIMSSRPAWTMKQDPVLKKIRKEKKKKGREGGRKKKMKKEWITSQAIIFSQFEYF